MKTQYVIAICLILSILSACGGGAPAAQPAEPAEVVPADTVAVVPTDTSVPQVEPSSAPSIEYPELVVGGVDLKALAEKLASAPAEGYEGITDDAGNPNRAATIDDILFGKALAPYFDEVEECYTFLKVNDYEEDVADDTELKEEYESATGKKFFCVADMMIYQADTMEAELYLPFYQALTGEEMTEEDFLAYVK